MTKILVHRASRIANSASYSVTSAVSRARQTWATWPVFALAVYTRALSVAQHPTCARPARKRMELPSSSARHAQTRAQLVTLSMSANAGARAVALAASIAILMILESA